MKSPCKLLVILIAALRVGSGDSDAQVVFQDLNFERAMIIPDATSPYYPYAITAANALPGWTVTGSVSYPDVLYNDVSLGAPAVTLQGPGSGFSQIQGNYFVYLQGGTVAGQHGVSIGQTGQIPADTKSLTFWGLASLDSVSIGGQLLSLTQLGSTPNYDIYGADISQFAGQTEQLLFSAPAQRGAYIDNIQFSPNPIPEPSTWALLFCAGGLSCAARKLRKQQ